METLNIYSALALKAPFEHIEELWSAKHPDIALNFFWHPSRIIEEKLQSEGVTGDIVIATVETLDRLITSGLVQDESRIELVDSPIGVAVKTGDPKPDISSTDLLVTSLLEARSVAWSEAGASGIYFSGLLKKLNIDKELRSRGTVITAGFTAEQLINGNADLAIQQISELLMVDGVDIVGSLPDEVQSPISLSAGLLIDTPLSVSSQYWLKWLKTPTVLDIFSQYGLTERH